MNTVKKEKIEELCIHYLDCMDIAAAAEKAGIEGDPLVTGTRLLSSRSAKRILKRLTDGELIYAKALAALVKLATCSHRDAYAVTDIKKGKDGVGECKLVSRLDALQLLLEISASDSQSDAESFFKALSGVRPEPSGDNDE